MFKCVKCTRSFTFGGNLVRHLKSHDNVSFSCTICDRIFSRKDSLKRHNVRIHHIDSENSLARCNNDEAGPSNQYLNSVRPTVTQDWENAFDDELLGQAMDSLDNQDSSSNKRKNGNLVSRQKKARLDMVGSAGEFVNIGTSNNNIITWYYRKNTLNLFNYTTFFNSFKSELIHILQEHVTQNPIKFNLKVEAEYNRPGVENSSVDRAFKTKAAPVLLDSDIEMLVDEAFVKILAEEDAFASKGSGFSLNHISGVLLAVYLYKPMSGSTYIPLPTDIINKKAIINPQNSDQECLKWSILAKHVTGDYKHRVGDNYKIHEEKYNFSGLSFPTPISEIRIFEKNNPGVSVNVYGLKEEKRDLTVKNLVFPLKVADDEKTIHFDLLFVKDEEKSHYTFISNFSRLIRSQKTLHTEHVYFCKRCFTSFDDQSYKYKRSGPAALDQHKKICGSHKPILPVMPEEGTILDFKGWSKTQRHPIVVYADFESLLLKIDERKGDYTMAFQSHKPMSYGFHVKAMDSVPVELLEQFNIPMEPVIFSDCETYDDIAGHFVETIIEVARNIEEILKTNIPIFMTEEDIIKHNNSRNCNLCKIGYTFDNHKVADHCHLSGKFRQSLCNNCNLKLQTPNFVPVFFHNLSNYDAHFIIRKLGLDENVVSIIPNSEEKFIAFSKFISNRFCIRFIDSFRFMASSLAKLAKNLKSDGLSKFKETSKFFKPEDLEYVTEKCDFCYEYIDDKEKLNETSIPPKEAFYSSLKEKDIKDKNYARVCKVWEHFKCKTLGEYSNLYLKVDVLLLADVFENFRNICLSVYNLDPAYYFTSPGLSFDAALKYTGIKLELLSSYEMLLMFEKGIRGGLCQASMRYAKANNYKTPDFDETKPKSWLIYQDCNNLYGWSMSQYMPHGGFKWVNPTLDGLNDMNETSPIGRVYEVDISYPQHLHDLHSDLPFLPENNIPPGSKVQKLMATLEPKRNYIIHYRNLQQAIANGLIVEKVHRVIQFNQSPWLAGYIKLNTEMRKKASNDFEKDFYKLMNNAVFGKTMESMRKRLKMELVAGDRKLQKLINKPTFKYCTPCGENLQIVSLENKIINFCKPVFTGFAVLEISKTLMYEYHYNVVKKHYNENINLMYTDTDSLVYYVKTEDFYDDLAKNPILLDRMDTANLPPDHPCYIAERKKIPGFFSDESDGYIIYEFAALGPKTYSYIIEIKEKIKNNKIIKKKEKIKAKGIRQHVVKRHMTFKDHIKCLFGDPTLNAVSTNVSIRSYNHHVKTIKSEKLTYNRNDDKRIIQDNQIDTLPWGHYRTKEMESMDEETDEL